MLRQALEAFSRPQAIVAVLIFCFVSLLGGRLLARAYERTARTGTCFGASVALVTCITLTPDGRPIPSGVVVDRFRFFHGLISISAIWHSLEGVADRPEKLANIALFVPVGFFGFVLTRHASQALAMGAILSLAVESIQTGLGRSGDLDDLTNNTVGVAVGLLIAISVRLLLRRSSGSSDSLAETNAHDFEG